MDHATAYYHLLERLWHPADRDTYQQILTILFDHYRFSLPRNALFHLLQDHHNEQVRACAVRLLGYTRDDALLPLLISYLDDPKQPESLRQHAALGLVALQTVAAEKIILHELASPDASVRIEMIAALSTGDHHFPITVFLDALHDPEIDVQGLALEGLENYADDVPLNAILPFLEHDDTSLRHAAISLLRAMPFSPTALPMLVERLISDTDDILRERAGQLLVDHLNELGDEAPFAAFTQALGDPYYPVRETALGAFRYVPTQIPVQPVLDLLNDPHDVVQMAAIQALQATRNPRFISDLQALLASLQSSNETDDDFGILANHSMHKHKVRRYAIRALMILQGFDIPDEPLFGIIEIS